MFKAVSPADLDTLFNSAAADLNTPWPALQKFFAVVCPLGIDPQTVADASGAFTQLFERVYIESLPALPTVIFPDDPLAVTQFYLDPAPVGFDAKFAWTQLGGDGLLVKVADVEHAWNLNHEDSEGFIHPVDHRL